MWETITTLIDSPMCLNILAHLIIIILIILIGVKLGIISVNTKHLNLGSNQKERDIIRQQIEWSYAFIMGLESKFNSKQYNPYFTKYILERIYDEVVNWITFNHINIESEYIVVKQEKLASIVYSLIVKEEFKTPEFRKQMDEWTENLIYRLVQIRKLYK
jgi:hypothetical protein